MPGSPFAAGSTISGQLGGSVGICTPSPFTAFNTYYQDAMTSYNNTISGYNKLAQQQSCAIAPITQGYTNLYNQVLGTICGIQQSQLQAVQCQFTKASGQTQQQLIGSGLGNSTVLQSAQRGNVAQEAQSQTQVQDQFAQLKAAYQSQLGLAGLNWQQQALAQQTALGVQQLKCMMIPLPNPAGFYNQFAAMTGQKPVNTVGPMGGGAGGVGALGSGGFRGRSGGACVGMGGYGGGGTTMYSGYCGGGGGGNYTSVGGNFGCGGGYCSSGGGYS
jgi:hypothetical protein